jgi:putative ABC transport system permease protein
VKGNDQQMLELVNIVKDYPAGDGTVHALKGVSLQFRPSEFVAILGQSGCGKTTMLNIIGGLDQYTQGDLIINGRSTKDYKDRDWDAYRNHSIGFVFQSYNLIPHQTVLQNVELALTLSGVGKQERRKRAIQALTQVGLGDQLRKKPSQMSGGQMQRVAIARALVNNPDILLADEPTGALDSETSVQVMDILKEVSKERLVIMVTHNPELAEEYATRTIRMLDGALISDSDPLSEREVETYRTEDQKRSAQKQKERKPSMKLTTSFGLSLKNLIAKRGRTTLTSFAGSIGIIGIALIYAVSQGMSTYINTVQEDTLSSYPLTIQASTVDLGSMIGAFMESAASKEEHDKDAVYSKGMLYDLVNALSAMETTENDLASFKVYLEQQWADPDSVLHEAISGLQYSYDLQLQVYTKNVDGKIIETDAQKLLQEMLIRHMGAEMGGMTAMQQSPMAMMGGSSARVWQEMLPGKNGRPISPLLEKQYDLVYGSWPNSYNEIVLVLDENNELADMTLYALGLKSLEDMEALMDAAVNGTTLNHQTERWSYEEICAMEFRVVLPGDCYTRDENTGLYMDLRETDAGVRYLYDNATTLKVTGIIRPNEEAVSAMLTGSIGYTSALTEHIIQRARESAVVKAQLENATVDVLTGLPFRENTGSLTDSEKEIAFRAHIATLNEAAQADAYIAIMSIPDDATLNAMLHQAMGNMTVEEMRAALLQALVTQMGMNQQTVSEYVNNMAEEDVIEIFTEMVTEQVKMQYAAQVVQKLAPMTDAQLAAALTVAMEGYSTELCALYYDEILEFSENSYEENLVLLGCLDLADPSAINIFAATFESKDAIEEAISNYNAQVDEARQINYTDYVGLMMSSITTIIDAITYVLISFVAISLVVSSIMIGVITLISVQERTKEIGILRAIGASKGNVSSMFNAETVLIGAASGGIGVGVTYLLCIPINAIIHALTGIAGLNAYLPWQVALVLVGISILLSVFAGVIPARSAAKKDPVVALRTE